MSIICAKKVSSNFFVISMKENELFHDALP